METCIVVKKFLGFFLEGYGEGVIWVRGLFSFVVFSVLFEIIVVIFYGI